MDYVPLVAPPSEHHPLNTGLSTENGTTAKGLIEGVNAAFTHVFDVLKGGVSHVVETIDDEARTHLTALEDVVTSLQQKVEALATSHAATAATVVAMSTPSEPPPASAPAKVDPAAGTTEHDQLLVAQARIAQLEAETAASTKTA